MGGLTVALFGGGKRKLLPGSGDAPLQHAGEHAGREHERAGAHRHGSPSHRAQGHLGHAFAHDSHRDAAVERAAEAPPAKPEAASEREVETEAFPRMEMGTEDATELQADDGTPGLGGAGGVTLRKELKGRPEGLATPKDYRREA